MRYYPSNAFWFQVFRRFPIFLHLKLPLRPCNLIGASRHPLPPIPKLSPIPFWNFWNRHSDCSKVPTQPQRATNWSWLQRVSIFFFLVLLGEYLNESFENLIEMLNVKYFMLSCYKKLEYRDWIEYIQVLFYVTILAAHLVISCKCESRVLKWVVYWVSILCKIWLNADTFQWINSNTL